MQRGYVCATELLAVFPMSRFYFDHNATTPVAPEVIEAVSEALRSGFGNASSIHAEGQNARQLLERAIASLAK